jgi:hypothetical protein
MRWLGHTYIVNNLYKFVSEDLKRIYHLGDLNVVAIKEILCADVGEDSLGSKSGPAGSSFNLGNERVGFR